MDWSAKIATAKRMIESKGAAMKLETTTHGAYNATTDSISATVATYDIVALISNPTRRNDAGEFSKSDRVRLLVPSDGIPASLAELDFRIVYGATIWHPETTIPLMPGGTPILFTIDMR
jgi:hypothetical protein